MLSAHQVDALSGTLTALLAETQPANAAASNGVVPEDVVARPETAELDPIEDEDEDEEDDLGDLEDEDEAPEEEEADPQE